MADTSNRKPMSDAEIVKLLEESIQLSSGLSDSSLSRERARVQDYYQGAKPFATQKGRSKYTSLDVYDSVENLKADLLEVFAGNDYVCEFEPEGEDDVAACDQQSEYTNYTIYRQNEGFDHIQTAIHDGLMSRVAIGRAYWKKVEDTIEEEFVGLTIDQVDSLLAEPDVELQELLFDEETELYEGTIVRTYDRSHVAIENIAPENFGISVRAEGLKRGQYEVLWIKERKSESDLRKEGYSEDLIKKIGPADSGRAWEDNEEVLSRFQGTEDDYTIGYDPFAEPKSKVWVYECYALLDVEGNGRDDLWKIIKAGNVVLDKEKVLRLPLVAFTPLPIPHSFWGNNYADKIVATQNAKTVLTRGILDHTVMTNNPRFEVLKGSLPNANELMDNRFGGIVNVNRQGAVNPLQQASLNPYVFQTIQLLDADLEDTTGVSRLATGTSKDAVSKQNSKDLISEMATLSQKRMKIIARNFAEQYLKELFILVSDLILENESREKVIQVNGQYVSIDPKLWKERRMAKVQLCLSHDQREKEAQRWLGLDQQLSADPAMASSYTYEKKYNVWKKALYKWGIKDVGNYITPPEQMQPPQPDPMVMKQLEIQERELATRERAQALAEAKFQHMVATDAAKAEMDEERFELDTAEKADTMALKERQQDHKERMDEGELEVLKSSEITETRGIASPTG